MKIDNITYTVKADGKHERYYTKYTNGAEHVAYNMRQLPVTSLFYIKTHRTRKISADNEQITIIW